MSGWLNNSFGKVSSLTGQIGGQISNFTREVLADEDDGGLIFSLNSSPLIGIRHFEIHF